MRAAPPTTSTTASERRASPVVWLPLAGADDAGLFHAALQGHPHATTVIWDRYARLIRGILRRMLGPSHDDQDLVQEVFLRFFQRLGDLRDPHALRGFLIGIAVHVAGTELRKRRVRRWLRLSDDGTVPDQAVEEMDPAAREALRRLYAILDRLDPRDRMAFALRFFEGMELTEVATALDCSLATTKRALAHACDRVAFHVRRDPLLAPYAARSGWAGPSSGET